MTIYIKIGYKTCSRKKLRHYLVILIQIFSIFEVTYLFNKYELESISIIINKY